MSSLRPDAVPLLARFAQDLRAVPERDPHVYFSAERTLLSWIRTGLAMMGFGFVVARFGLFLRELAVVRGDAPVPGGGSLWAGTSLVLLGVLVNFYAAAAHSRFVARFENGDSTPQHSRFGIAIASALAAAGFAMAVYLIAH
jgi:putative membrane protein